MSIIDALSKAEVWQEFYEYKKEKAHLSKWDEQALFLFIENKAYLSLASQLADGNYCFGLPRKLLINKMGTTKKRAVYSFAEDETMLLKLLSYLLYRYDGYFAGNLYSFRKNKGAAYAVRKLTAEPTLGEMYCYKADVSDYFNSINIEMLLPMLAEMMPAEEKLLLFLGRLLREERVEYEGAVIREQKGVMAGIPIAPFLANVYLHGLDCIFEKRRIPYARYSDDIICFAPDKEKIEEHKKQIYSWLSEYGLCINSGKEYLYHPGEAWEFLGIRYLKCAGGGNGKIDLSQATVDKMKGKIRRKARAMYRWAKRKNVEERTVMRTFIRIFNRKFYEGADANDLTWARWFFPLLTTDESLKVIDAYMQQYIRYLATGRHSKANYRTDYAGMKELGYQSLVYEYYKYRRGDS